MAKITVTGYEVACDPGINHFTTYRGEPIDVNDIQPGIQVCIHVPYAYRVHRVLPEPCYTQTG